MSELKKIQPEVEDVVKDILDGDVQKNALDFVVYLKDNKINPQWSATNAWKISYRNYSVCFIRLYGAADYYNIQAGSWQIIPFIGEYHESCLSDDLKEIVWLNKRTCKVCGKCGLPISKVFGKEYDYACEKSIVFTDPDIKSIECIKKLIELRKEDIKEGKAKKHKYIPMRDR